MIRLLAGDAQAGILPDVGAGLTGLSVDGRPVLRPWSGRSADGPFALAMNLLLPFSNRIDRGFDFAGQHHDLAPNLPGEPFPIHGDAFQRPWRVVRSSGAAATLALDGGAFGPWRYSAEVRFVLTGQSLSAELALTNRGGATLPFGLGFHPWFPRLPGTLLRFDATAVWEEDGRHLRRSDRPEPLPEALSFARPAALPAGWINAGFAGWDGRADIIQPAPAQGCRITARDLDTLLVYSPDAAADFFCAEPVSHPVDAHNLAGMPGLRPLRPGEAMSAALRIEWGRPDD